MSMFVCCRFVAVALPLIQVPEAPFADKPVELECPAPVLRDSSIEAGTKRLEWRNLENNLAVVANGRTVALWQTRVEPSYPEWQPLQRFEVVVRSNAVIRTCPFSLTKDAGGNFIQRFAVENGRAVVVSQFVATNGTPVRVQTMPILLPRECVNGRTIRIVDRNGGIRTIKVPVDSRWDTREKSTDTLWESMVYCADPAEVTFDPEHPEYSFTLYFEAERIKHFHIFRSLSGAEIYLSFREDAIGKPFRQEVAFGKSARRAAGDCIVNGVNFTQSNAFEVPHWGRRNLLNNPSFEADSRFWHDIIVSRMTDNDLVPEAHSGKKGYLLSGVRSFCVATKANRKYTFSCWAKSVAGDGGSVVFNTCNYTGEGNVRNRTLGLRKGTRDWQRLSCTFDWPHRGMALNIGSWTRGKVVIDDLQLEEGERATEFECPPFAVVLKTDSPDRYYGDADQVFNPRLVIRGTAGDGGLAKITVTDFFGRKAHQDEKFTIGADGETEIAACPESAVLQKGVHVIRVELDRGDGRPVIDHLRVVRYRYAKGDEPNCELHQVEGFGIFDRGQFDYDPVNWHRIRSQGFSSFSRVLGDWQGVYDEKLRRRGAAWYLDHGGRVKQPVFSPLLSNREKPETPFFPYLHEEGVAWENMPDKTTGYGEKEQAAVERAAERLARENPWCVDWIGASEIGVNWVLTKTHNYREYAKIMMAVHRGLKRGNPKAVFIPHGTCNAGRQGRAEHHEFLEATKAVDPTWAWDGLQVHPYRLHPEFPSLESDLKLLFSDMARHNMKDGLVYADEGAYFHPILVKEWGMAPWAGVGETDAYFLMHSPTYDVGWGERVATAMLMRYNLQCYRFIPKIRYVTCWNLCTLDTSVPWAVSVGTAAETELLGHATFVKDIRFGDGARAYFFDDHRGHGVAAVWKFNVALDKGVEPAASMSVKLPGSCEILDMMANPCRAECDGEGLSSLPLSNFPVFLRVPRAELDALVKSLESSRTTDDGKARKIYDPAPVPITECGERPDWAAVKPFKLPYVKLGDASVRAGLKWEGPQDLSAECRMAWNPRGLFLKVEVRDDKFVIDRSSYIFGMTQWYDCEGVQVFFDNLGDARENLKMEMQGYDENDSSYELLPTGPDAAVVYRRLAPDIQQTGGVSDSLKSEVAVPELNCSFLWNPKRGVRTYEVFFPARQLMPMQLKEGSRIGCSFTIFDRDAPGKMAKQTVTDIPSELGSAFQRPHLYSNFILTRSR